MFDFVRDHKRVLQFLLVLLIVPSFVFFGVQGFTRFTDASNVTVAKVAGGAIKQFELDAAHRQQIERMRQQMPGVDVSLLDTPEMKQRTLEALVRERVLATAVSKQHLVVSDDRLASELQRMPELASIRSANGAVDKAAYTALLAAQGLSPAGFEANLRRDLALQQVLQGVSSSTVASSGSSKALIDALLDQREIQVQRFSSTDYLAKVQPTDADIESYYKSHADRFRSPEEASIEYVVLDLDTLRKQVSVSEDDLQAYYKQNQSRFDVAEERRASHILVSVPKEASTPQKETAKAKAERLLAEVRKNPAAFADVAKRESQDPGSAEKGGDLDYFGRGAMVKPFEDAVFAMKVDEISNVVMSDFGFHIIRLTGVRGGKPQPFEAVRDQLLEEIGKQQAQKKFTEVAEQFSNTVYEQPDSLAPIAEKLKLSVQTANVSRTPAPGASGVLAAKKLLDAVFASESISSKRNSEAIETAPNQLVSARVVTYRPQRVLPLSEVRTQALDQVRAEQAAAAAQKDGKSREDALKKDMNATLSQTLVVSRTQTRELPRSIVEAALRADISKGPSVVGVDLGATGYAVVKVSKSVPRDASDPDRARAQPYVREALSRAETAAYYEAMKRRFKTEVSWGPAPSAASAASN